MKIFAIRDKKAMRYIPQLMLFEGFVDAERWLQDLVNDSRSIVCKYPSDFCLVFLGEFDVNSGLCSLKSVPDIVHEAVSFVADNGDSKLVSSDIDGFRPAAKER